MTVGKSETPFIQCENLVKVYRIGDQEVFALQGLDLTVARGELSAIVGASGSGKSTLLNILGGLDRPTAGMALVDGMNLLKMSGFRLVSGPFFDFYSTQCHFGEKALENA